MIRFFSICLCILALSFPIAAAEHGYSRGETPAYLVVKSMTNTGVNSFHHEYHKMPSMDVCIDVIKNAKVEVAKGGDAEASIALYCVTVKPEE